MADIRTFLEDQITSLDGQLTEAQKRLEQLALTQRQIDQLTGAKAVAVRTLAVLDAPPPPDDGA